MKLFKCLAIFAANTQACIPPLLFVGTTEACIPPLLFAGSTEACPFLIPALIAILTGGLRDDIDGANEEQSFFWKSIAWILVQLSYSFYT